MYGLVQNHHINEIVIPERWSSMREMIQLLHDLKDLNINWKFVPTGKKMLIGKGMVENLSGVPLMDIELPLFEKVHQITKRIFDITFSSLLIFLTIPYHVYFILRSKVSEKTAWSIHGQHIHVYHYMSKATIIQDMPLLFMIFKGSMSFVGTQVIDITNKDPRLIVKPGLTGLMHLRDSDIEYDEIRNIEQYYAMHYSLVFDIEIILKSILRL
jgi:lipopolysaccharide/colanic/teichoic acid biosynthesis glycosyltransferase